MSEEQVVDSGGSIVLTTEQKKSLLAIAENKNRLKLDQEAIKDDVKAVSEKLGISVGEINEIVNIIMKEQEKGGVILAKTKTLSLAEQVLVGTSD